MLSLPVARRWRCDYGGIVACRCFQGKSLIKRVKFGRDFVTATPFIENSQVLEYVFINVLRIFWICWYVQPARSQFQHKTCHFLLPAAGAMTLSESWHMDVFRAELLNCMQMLQMWACRLKLQQLPVFWRIIDFGRHATGTLFHENSPFEQLLIVSGFTQHRSEVGWTKSRGGICYGAL